MHDLYFYSTDLIFFSKVRSGLELHAPRLCRRPLDNYPALRPGTESHTESPISELLLILSQQKIFNYFMHMRAKTICGLRGRTERWVP